MAGIENAFSSITISGGNNIIGSNVDGTLNFTTGHTPQLHEKLIHSLEFPLQGARFQQISEAYSSTCEWIFRPPHPHSAAKAWFNFNDWLETDDTIYWIHGKPGSGKSTLMKFLASHPTVKERLQIWANKLCIQHVVIVSHYFWRPGAAEQNGLAGCLRALLVGLLQEQPSKAAVLQPLYDSDRFWSNQSLEEALRLFLQDKNTFYLLLIDGLDEFVGSQDSQDALIALIEDLASESNVKVCLSSRPEIFFQDTFGQYKSLRVQDLNRSDLETTARGRLSKNPRFRQYMTSEKADAEALVAKVCDRSYGIFLWLHLALEDLIHGLKRRDPLKMLHNRLDCLGSSLTSLFSTLLDRIDSVDKVLATTLLHAMMLSDDFSFNFIHCYVILEIALKESRLELPDPNRLAEKASAGHWASNEELFHALFDLHETLSEKTAGLLEVVNVSDCSAEVLKDCSCFGLEIRAEIEHPALCAVLAHFGGAYVTGVHRSVHDFLRSAPTATAAITEYSLISDPPQILWSRMGAGVVNLHLRAMAEVLDINKRTGWTEKLRPSESTAHDESDFLLRVNNLSPLLLHLIIGCKQAIVSVYNIFWVKADMSCEDRFAVALADTIQLLQSDRALCDQVVEGCTAFRKVVSDLLDSSKAQQWDLSIFKSGTPYYLALTVPEIEEFETFLQMSRLGTDHLISTKSKPCGALSFFFGMGMSEEMALDFFVARLRSGESFQNCLRQTKLLAGRDAIGERTGYLGGTTIWTGIERICLRLTAKMTDRYSDVVDALREFVSNSADVEAPACIDEFRGDMQELGTIFIREGKSPLAVFDSYRTDLDHDRLTGYRGVRDILVARNAPYWTKLTLNKLQSPDTNYLEYDADTMAVPNSVEVVLNEANAQKLAHVWRCHVWQLENFKWDFLAEETHAQGTFATVYLRSKEAIQAAGLPREDCEYCNKQDEESDGESTREQSG